MTTYQMLIDAIRYDVTLFTTSLFMMGTMWDMLNDHAKAALGVNNPF
jgi:hypothetical protein